MVHADERIKAIPIAYGKTSMEEVARILTERARRRAFEDRKALLALQSSTHG